MVYFSFVFLYYNHGKEKYLHLYIEKCLLLEQKRLLLEKIKKQKE